MNHNQIQRYVLGSEVLLVRYWRCSELRLLNVWSWLRAGYVWIPFLKSLKNCLCPQTARAFTCIQLSAFHIVWISKSMIWSGSQSKWTGKARTILCDALLLWSLISVYVWCCSKFESDEKETVYSGQKSTSVLCRRKKLFWPQVVVIKQICFGINIAVLVGRPEQCIMSKRYSSISSQTNCLAWDISQIADHQT